MDIQAEILQAVRNGIASGVSDKLKNSYNSPLDKVLTQVIAAEEPEIRKLIAEAFTAALSEAEFREGVKSGIRTKLASLLVQRFGGELEKQVNALKSDPATRARITCAIDDIVNTAKA